MKKVIIAGSSRKDGDLENLVKDLTDKSDWDVIDLNDYNFSYFDYDHQNRGDDFIPLMRRILEKYETLIFATPVYWYAMSGIMKVFFDRITDLITIEKELGRQLRTKKMAAVSSSNGNNLGEHFWLPFTESAKYLGIEYLSSLHTVAGEEQKEGIQLFINLIDQ